MKWMVNICDEPIARNAKMKEKCNQGKEYDEKIVNEKEQRMN